jgi:hypothetical protein
MLEPAMGPCLATTVQHLFDAVYSPGGPYNQRFRHQIQSLCHTHAEQLRKGKKLYDATARLDSRGVFHGTLQRDSASFSAEKDASLDLEKDGNTLEADDMWLELLQPFVELASEQLKGICELHFDDLSRWLAVTWDGNEDSDLRSRFGTTPTLGGRLGSPHMPNLTITDEAAVGGEVNAVGFEGPKDLLEGPLWVSDATESMISLLKHIGRMDTDLAFLANMGEMCEMAEMEKTSLPSKDELAIRWKRRACQMAEMENTSAPPPTAPAVPPGMLGEWDLCGKQSLKQLEALYGRFFKAVGYPWFLRQFMMRVFSTLTLVDKGEAGLLLTPVGKFMGFMLPQGQQFNEVPGIEFRHQVHHNTDPADSPINPLTIPHYCSPSYRTSRQRAPNGRSPANRQLLRCCKNWLIALPTLMPPSSAAKMAVCTQTCCTTTPDTTLLLDMTPAYSISDKCAAGWSTCAMSMKLGCRETW